MILLVSDAFIVVIDSHGQSHLSVVLSNDIFVEDRINVLRLREIGNPLSRRFPEFLVEHLVAQGNALIAKCKHYGQQSVSGPDSASYRPKSRYNLDRTGLYNHRMPCDTPPYNWGKTVLSINQA